MITAALLLSLVAAEAGPAAPAYLGLAIGHNQGPTPQTAPLRYADDEAIRRGTPYASPPSPMEVS